MFSPHFNAYLPLASPSDTMSSIEGENADCPVCWGAGQHAPGCEREICSAELWEPTHAWHVTDWARAYLNIQWLECESGCGA